MNQRNVASILGIVALSTLGLGCSAPLKSLHKDQLDEGFQSVAVMNIKIIDHTRSLGGIRSVPFVWCWYPQPVGDKDREFVQDNLPRGDWQDSPAGNVYEQALTMQVKSGRLVFADLAINTDRYHFSFDVYQETTLSAGSFHSLGTLTIDVSAVRPLGTGAADVDFVASINHDSTNVVANDEMARASFQSRYPTTAKAMLLPPIVATWHSVAKSSILP